MKHLLTALAVLLALAACGHLGTTAPADDIALAEQALEQGRYAKAQRIADTLVLGNSFGALSVDEKCRLAMLFMQLSENAEDAGGATAAATRCFSAALAADSDSTMLFMRNLEGENRARAMVLTALYEASERTVSADSIVIPPDSIPDNEL